jgi:glycosyltransferase involved in cell wall biosynthesis
MDADCACQPDITVAICTWNRADLLDLTLEHLSRQDLTDVASFEVLVVDNASTDRTAQVLQARSGGSLPLRSIAEPHQGLSNARNAAVAAARGKHVIWTDDDVCVAPGWLAAYQAAFRAHPDAVFFGGPILPRFLGRPPRWLLRGIECVSTAYALRDFGDGAFQLDRGRLPFGANMAFRSDALRRDSFDPALGRVGAKLLSGEESAVMSSLLENGATGWWVPAATVEHMIPPERQTLGYLRDYYAAWGRTSHRMNGREPGRRQLLGAPLWLWRQTIEAHARYLAARYAVPASSWLRHYRDMMVQRGKLGSYREESRSGLTS